MQDTSALITVKSPDQAKPIKTSQVHLYIYIYPDGNKSL